MIYKCYFDGSCGPPNPHGEMGMGVYVTCGEQEFGKSEHLPAKKGNSNNVAEYLAVIMVFKLLRKKEGCIIKIYGDSKMVINQLANGWQVKNGYYVKHAREAKLLYEELLGKNTINMIWINRDKNWKADELSKAHIK